mmetsp:Transcript_16796/g.41242  ORF Transcript_16796/g.41242 Transcript_16796/m.41242 type:complete len:426 (+) Transcript_16796:1154-2431(+)
MAGKSTVLRSAAALALLASCGLHCPVRTAAVPFFDHLIVRMSSTDSPAEGLSSYAVEMGEVGQMLRQCSPHSLVFIDELGRGTEAHHGTAMAGAVVEALDARGARGIFATHLHGLLDLPLELSPFVRRMRMETAPVVVTATGGRGGGEGGGLTKWVRPTWRMVPGECRESLALQTAVDMGVSHEVVRRSTELLKVLKAPGPTPPGAPGSSTTGPSGTRGGVAASGAKWGPASYANANAHALPEMTLNTFTNGGNGGGGIGGGGIGGGSVGKSSPAPPLEDLLKILDETARRIPAFAGASRGGALGMVRGWEVFPPGAAGWTCVYVLRRSDGWVYCGETDNIAGRLEAHRAAAVRDAGTTTAGGGNNNNNNIEVEVAYLEVPREAGGRSAARALETRVIERLQAQRVPLLSGYDARNSSFGSAMTS